MDMKTRTRGIVFLAAMISASIGWADISEAGECVGRVVGVKPISQYNHAKGSGFLAVRTGPGGKYRQVGEVYRGDEVAVFGRRGKWFHVNCLSGQCMNPLWGPAIPEGWVHGSYLRVPSPCP